MANPKEPPSVSLTPVSTLHFETRSTPFVYRNKSKAISFARQKTITTWNWETGQKTSTSILSCGVNSITDIKELPNGKLVVGTDNGSIFIQRKSSWSLVICGCCATLHSPITKLLIIGPSHVFYKSGVGDKVLINFNNENKVDFGRQTRFCVYRENVIACLSDKGVDIKSVHNLSKRLHFHYNKGFSDMRAEKGQFILLKHEDRTAVTIWDVENIRSLEAPLNSAIHTDQFQTLVLINYTTFIVPDWDGSVFLKKMSYSEQQSKWFYEKSESAGKWEATSMIHVGGCIMYATVPAWSGIHAFDKNLSLLYTGQELTDDGDGYPLALEALGNGYVAIQFGDSVSIVKRKKYNKRLLIGEGDFSYAEALVNKHSALAGAIIASELKKRHEVGEKDRLEYLESMGVELLFGIDAQWLHQYERFSSCRIKRIHWNCPYGDSAYSMSQGTFKKVIINFFNSCSKIQSIGDRIYVTLMQEEDYWRTRQKENPIVLGSVSGGYVLIAKRAFGRRRYPGYKHRTTDGYAYYSYDDKMREFVFKKVSKKVRAFRKSQFLYQENLSDSYFDCATDSDSSCYEDSDDE